MQRIVIPFDRERISEEEIVEHIRWYYFKAEEGSKLAHDGKKKEAMEILREINANLNKEYKYYDKIAIRKHVRDNQLFSTYTDTIFEVSAKQNSKNSYAALSSNFWDIKDYLVNYNGFRKYIE